MSTEKTTNTSPSKPIPKPPPPPPNDTIKTDKSRLPVRSDTIKPEK